MQCVPSEQAVCSCLLAASQRGRPPHRLEVPRLKMKLGISGILGLLLFSVLIQVSPLFKSLFCLIYCVQAIFLPSLAIWKHLIIFLLSVAGLLYHRVSFHLRLVVWFHIKSLLSVKHVFGIKLVLSFISYHFFRAGSHHHLIFPNFLLTGSLTIISDDYEMDSMLIINQLIGVSRVLVCNIFNPFSLG